MKRRWHRVRHREELSRFVRFILVGGLNTAVGYGLFAAAIFVGLAPTPAVVAATILGVLFNYKSFATLAFQKRSESRLVRFVGVYLLQLALNLALLRLMMSAGLSPLLGQALLLPAMAVFTYLLLRHWVFAGPEETQAPTALR